MTWDAIIEKYPDRWVVLTNVVFDGVDVVSADVVDVKPDAEISAYKAKHRADGYIFRRTTEEDWNGIIVTSFITSTVQS